MWEAGVGRVGESNGGGIGTTVIAQHKKRGKKRNFVGKKGEARNTQSNEKQGLIT